MRIAVIGAGRVGSALGRRWSEVGHEVVYGVRHPGDVGYSGMVGSVTTIDACLDGADVVVLAVPWAATEAVARAVGNAGGAVIVDATNPLAGDRRTHEPPPVTSGAEQVAAWSGSTRVVKAFNVTGAANMADPQYPGGAPLMPVAGDDAAAKQVVMDLAGQIGFDPVDAGSLAGARELEHLAVLWIRLAYQLGNGPGIAFSLLRR